ncbi:hypothetical protein HY732_01145 [Candidatus Uhrbacteria bacterium]|nr:hypothetical protein [Candidatus Uhrbacteria bacterium]
MKRSEKSLRRTIAQSKKPLIILFTAEWCRPCVATLKEIGHIRSSRFVPRIIEVDIERNPEIGNAFGVINLPTLMLYENGRRKKMHVGAWCSDNAMSSFLRWPNR